MVRSDMRICLISSEYPPETAFGGISTHTHTLSHALANAGHEVHVVSMSLTKPKEYLDGKVFVHRLFAGKGARNWLAYRTKVAKKVLDLAPFDIVDCPDFNAEGLIVSLGKSTIFKKTPFVTMLHTPSFVVDRIIGEAGATYNSRLSWRLLSLAEKTQIVRSDALRCGTKSAAALIVRTLGETKPIRIIPDGIDVEDARRFEPMDLSSFPDNYVVYLGRLEPRKGIHVLAHALRIVFQSNPTLKVILVGRDTAFRGSTMKRYVLEVNRGYEENLIFTGYVGDQLKKNLVKNARFVVNPSLSEGFGYSALEAMALGKAVIAARSTGLSDIIVSGQSGLLVKPSDPDELAAAILNFLNSDLTDIEKEAVKKAEFYDIRQLIPQYNDFYSDTIEKVRYKRARIR